MGFGGISIWSLLLILAIVVLLFGTKKLRNIGSDFGAAIKNFKTAVRDEKEEAAAKEAEKLADNSKVIEGEVTKKEQDKA